MREKWEKGNRAKHDIGERTQLAIIEAIALYKEGKPPMEIIKELGMRYPDVALSFVKRLGKGGLSGGLEGLGGLFES